MLDTPHSRSSSSRAVIYGGRFADRIPAASLQAESVVLDDWDVLPLRLADVLGRASVLVVLDPLSFPYEAMSRWDVPFVVVVPPEFDADFLVSVLGTPLFEKLEFFDRVAVRDDVVWEELRRRYRWAGGQRLRIESYERGAAAEEICAMLEPVSPDVSPGEQYDALRYWKERGEELAATAPHRAVGSVHHGVDFNKAMHLTQRAALEPQFAAARGTEGTSFDVLEVGCGVGRWAASFDPVDSRFVGLDVSGGMIEAARANFPDAVFEIMDDDLTFPFEDESFELAFTVSVMHHNPASHKRRLLAEMWRVVRPGGRLMFLEDFVVGGGSGESIVYPTSVLKFVDLVLEVTAGQVVLEYVRSLRYPHDDFFRSGVISLSKLGVPRKW